MQLEYMQARLSYKLKIVSKPLLSLVETLPPSLPLEAKRHPHFLAASTFCSSFARPRSLSTMTIKTAFDASTPFIHLVPMQTQ